MLTRLLKKHCAYCGATAMDTAATAEYLESSLAEFQSGVDSSVFPEMEANGITESPKVAYTYYNSDGTLIWTHTFEPS